MKFAGDKKVGESILGKLEKKWRTKLVPLVPKKVETYHLTISTLVWSILIIIFSFFAEYFTIHWLWGVSLMILFQYITDLLDGEIGRQRNTGLIKWGYYMDHFLDYIFLCSILIGYMIIVPDELKYLQFFILGIFGAFMVNSFLAFAATNKFKISYSGLGPTEIRLVFIIMNTLIILAGKTYLGPALPYVLVLSIFGLIYTVYQTQKEIWKIDMKEKNK